MQSNCENFSGTRAVIFIICQSIENRLPTASMHFDHDVANLTQPLDALGKELFFTALNINLQEINPVQTIFAHYVGNGARCYRD